MRHTWMALAVVLVVPAAGWAQAVDPALKAAVEARTAARIAADAETYAKYVTDDAVITSANGTVDTKASRIKALQGRPTAGPRPKVSDEKYRIYGDTAIRTWREDVTVEGKPRGTRWIEVWVKQLGAWKMASVQFTNIQPPR